METNRGLVLLVLLSCACGAQAQNVFKCVDCGRTVYSQVPCGPVAAELGIKTAPLSSYEMRIVERRNSFFRANPDVDDQTKQAVLSGRVFVGMSEDAARAAWGRPTDINRTQTAFGEKRQYVYRAVAGSWARYLYVEDGVVTAIQD